MTNEHTPPTPAESDDAVAPEKLAIHIRGLTKSYGDKIALNSLDLNIRQGDIFGYIGPNGAGKTTTIRILAGLLASSAGIAEIHSVDVGRYPQRIKRLVGYMPDSFGVYDNMTLTEYLGFFAAAYKIPTKKRKPVIDDVLELTDLTSKSDELVNAFSRGMKQRACLAKTLLHDPKVLILDEPASGLDPRARIEFRELLKELQKMGKTILVSSHILTELSTICNTIGIIESGNLVAAGEVDHILKNLRSHRRFTVKLLDRDHAARAEKWLANRAHVENVRLEASTVTLEIAANDDDVANLLDGLVHEGIRTVSFNEEVEDLETAFMALTRGEVA